MSPHMPRRSSIAVAVAALVASAMTGCASPPPTHWHTLLPVELVSTGSAGTRPAGDGNAIAVSIAPVRLPAQVDRAQWLVRLPDGGVVLLEQERWASPLADEIRLALAASLAARSGIFESPAAAGAGPSVRIAVDVRRFESLPGLEARIGGTWTLSPVAKGRVAQCEFLYREPAATGGFNALADAHVRAVSRLAAAIGDAVLGRDGCPQPAPR